MNAHWSKVVVNTVPLTMIAVADEPERLFKKLQLKNRIVLLPPSISQIAPPKPIVALLFSKLQAIISMKKGVLSTFFSVQIEAASVA